MFLCVCVCAHVCVCVCVCEYRLPSRHNEYNNVKTMPFLHECVYLTLFTMNSQCTTMQILANGEQQTPFAYDFKFFLFVCLFVCILVKMLKVRPNTISRNSTSLLFPSDFIEPITRTFL